MNQIHDTYIRFSEERALIIMATFIKTNFFMGRHPGAHRSSTNTFAPSLNIGSAYFESKAPRSLEELLVEANRFLYVNKCDKWNGRNDP